MQLTEERSKLPIASFKDVIASTVESHQVNLLICFVKLPLEMHLLDILVSDCTIIIK